MHEVAGSNPVRATIFWPGSSSVERVPFRTLLSPGLIQPKENMARRMDILEITGSTGEGGGQVLRTALSLSVALGRAVRIAKIRAGRAKPG